MPVILIDGSYYVFHKYYAIMSWWKRAHKDISESGIDPIDHDIFVSTFRKTFANKIKNFIKLMKFQEGSYKLYVAKDCPQADIWRQAHINKYKGTRDYTNFKGGPFFQLSYSELFNELGAETIQHEHLEADDCVAYFAKHYSEKDEKVYIFANDHDYMQLINHNIEVYTLKGDILSNHKNFYGSAEKALFMKILLGDKSDNIPPVFEKCGVKTAEKYYNDRELLKKKLEENPEANKRLETNTHIIDFKNIPSEYISELKNKYNLN